MQNLNMAGLPSCPLAVPYWQPMRRILPCAAAQRFNPKSVTGKAQSQFGIFGEIMRVLAADFL